MAFTKAYIEKTGGKVVGEEYLPMDGSDWTSIISKLKSGGTGCPDHIDGRRSADVTLTKQLRAAGVALPYCNLAVDEGHRQGYGDRRRRHLPLGLLCDGHRQRRQQELYGRHAEEIRGRLKTPNDLSVPEYEAGLCLQGRGRKRPAAPNRPRS